MRRAREGWRATWRQGVTFCDGCGQVCTSGCRAAAARAAAVERRLTVGPLW
jgi:hypothetical protein